MRPPLTPKQRLVFQTIVTYWQTNLSSPSIRDLCSLLGIVSTNGIVSHLRPLQKKGYIEREVTRQVRRKDRIPGTPNGSRTRSIIVPGMAIAFPDWVKDV